MTRALIQAAEYLARQPEGRYDDSPLIRTALFSGLRLGELLGLQWQDADIYEGVLYVRGVSGHSGRVRVAQDGSCDSAHPTLG